MGLELYYNWALPCEFLCWLSIPSPPLFNLFLKIHQFQVLKLRWWWTTIQNALQAKNIYHIQRGRLLYFLHEGLRNLIMRLLEGFVSWDNFARHG
jgi:hypothetical protein